MGKKYLKPKVLGREMLTLNMSIAECSSTVPAGEGYWVYEWGGATYGEINADSFADVLDFVMNDDASYWKGSSEEVVAPHIFYAFGVNHDGWAFLYEDKPPYLRSWNDAPMYSTQWAVQNGVGDDNWQNVHPLNGQDPSGASNWENEQKQAGLIIS